MENIKKEELIEFLSENLSIQLDINSNGYIITKLLLCDKLISDDIIDIKSIQNYGKY